MPMEDYVQLAEKCLEYEPANRPSFVDVAISLERMYKKLKRNEVTARSQPAVA